MSSRGHSSWCVVHDGESMYGRLGLCACPIEFGPYLPNAEQSAGCLSVELAETYPEESQASGVRVRLDYRTLMIGTIDLTALRSLHEALKEDPEGLRAAIERAIELVGSDVPGVFLTEAVV